MMSCCRLEGGDLVLLEKVAALNWSAIEPAIFGTLFERGLDPSKRDQLGAHYTDPTMIERIIQAVITRPLLAEWAEVRDEMTRRLSGAETAQPAAPRQRRTTTPTLFESLPLAGPAEPRQRARRPATTPASEAKALRDAFLER